MKQIKIIWILLFLLILVTLNSFAQEEKQIRNNYYVELKGFQSKEIEYIKSKLFNKWAKLPRDSEEYLFDISENNKDMKERKFLECFYDIKDIGNKKSLSNTRRLVVLYEKKDKKFYVMIYRWNVRSWLRIRNSGSFIIQEGAIETQELLDRIIRTTVIMTMK